MTWKKWLIRSLICCFLAFMVAGGVLFALWTNPAAVRQLFQEQLGERFVNVTVHVGSARLRLLGGVLVHELRMARSQGLETQDFLFVPTTVLYHDKEHILAGKFGIRKIDMDRPQIRIVRERNGRFNVSGLLGPVNLKERLPTVVIRNGTLLFEDRSACPGTPLLEINQLQLTLLNDPLPTLTFQGTGEVDLLGPVRLSGSITRATMATRLEVDHPAIVVNEELWRRVRLLFPSSGPHLRHLNGRAEANIRLNMPGNDASPGTPVGHEVRLRFHDGGFHHPHLPLSLEKIDLEARLVNGVIPAAKLTASSGDTRLDFRLEEFRLPAGAVEADMATLHRLVRTLDARVTQLPVTDALLACLPPELGFIKEDYSPSGPVSIRYRYRRPDAAPGSPGRKEWTIEPKGMAGSYVHFPYPLHDVRGAIWVDTSAGPRVGNIRIDLTGRGGPGTATLRGTIQGERKVSGIDLHINAHDVSLDDHFMKALPERAQKVARQFLPGASRQHGLAVHPMGKADVVAEFTRPRGTTRLEKRFMLRIKQASALYDQFPYPLEDVSGLLELHPDHWCCKNFRARHNGGEIRFAGRSYRSPSAPGLTGALPVSVADAAALSGTVKISFVGENLQLDQEFTQALQPLSGPNRDGLQRAWKVMGMSGRMNFTAEVVNRADQPQDIEVSVSLQGPSMRPAFFNYALDGVSGTVKYARGRVALADVRGRHGATTLGVASGLLQLRGEGGFTAWLTGLTARRLTIDADLIRALPETIRHVLEPLKIQTPVEVATNMTLINPPGAARLPEVWWEGALGLDRARFRAGIEVTDATGQLFCKGYHDGQKLRGVNSQLRIATATLFGQPLTNVVARLDIEPSSNDVLRIRDLQAGLFGGTVYGQGRLETGSALKYDLLLEALGIRLDAFGKHNFPQAAQKAQLHGPVRASVHLQGQGNDLLGLKGNGRIDVVQGKMGQLPVLLDLIKAFGLRIPDRTAFEQAHTVFAIEGPQLLVRQLELVGNAISLNGQGKLDLDGSNIELDFNATPGRFTQFLPSGIDGIPPMISEQLLKIKMRGKFGKEGKIRFDKELVPSVMEPIKRVFQGAS